MAEAITMLLAVDFICSLSYHNVIFKGGALAIIKLVENNAST